MITNINPGMFRQYDIRGIVGKDLTTDIANLIGKAFGTYLCSRLTTHNSRFKVSVGRDVRLSSNILRDALIQGILSTGIDVIDIGGCPTPLQYFSIFHLNLDGGVMITGSHNPPEFNGFKISVGRETIYGQGIQEIRRIVEDKSQKSEARSQKSEGKIEYYEIIPAYMDYLKQRFSKSCPDKPVKVVIDSGNGTAGPIAPKILKELGYDVIELFCEPDGSFPNHHPDPTIPDNLKDLIEMVKTQGADIGIAYDGDADRLGVVDENGNIIWGDQLMIIFAKDILESCKLQVASCKSKLTFVGEVKCSQVMYDEIERLGGNAIMWKTGHSLIRSKMKETGAVLAGEMSGHIFFADRYFGYDDAIYATCRLLEILSKQRLTGHEIKFSSLLSGLPRTYATPEMRVDCPDDEKFGVIDRLSDVISQDSEGVKIKDIIRIDGLRIVFDNGWALVRASNTQPVLVLRFEAAADKILREIKRFVEERLSRVISGS